MKWTPELDDCIRQSIATGKSSSEIARHLNLHGFPVSRNAVIGRKKRLGLCTEGVPWKGGNRVRERGWNPKAPKPPPRTITLPTIPAARPLLAIVRTLRPAPVGGVSLTHLQHDYCRFPIGDPKAAGFHFCGAEVHPGKPYCTSHCEIAYVKLSRRGKFHPWTPQNRRDHKAMLLQAAE